MTQVIATPYACFEVSDQVFNLLLDQEDQHYLENCNHINRCMQQHSNTLDLVTALVAYGEDQFTQGRISCIDSAEESWRALADQLAATDSMPEFVSLASQENVETILDAVEGRSSSLAIDTVFNWGQLCYQQGEVSGLLSAAVAWRQAADYHSGNFALKDL